MCAKEGIIQTVSCAESLRRFLAEKVGDQSLLIEHLWDGPKALLFKLIQEKTGKDIVVVTGGVRENRLLSDLPFFGLDGVEFPSWEILPGEAIAPSKDIVGRRLSVLYSLIEQSSPKVILTPLQALLHKIPSKEELSKYYLNWAVGSEFPFDALQAKFEELGYQPSSIVADKGEFAIRNGRVDIFPIASPAPFRIEFFGDEISSIRTFDPISQKSVEKVTTLSISPANELSRPSVFLTDYLSANALIVFDELLELEEKWLYFQESGATRLPAFASMEQFAKSVESHPKWFFTHESLSAWVKTKRRSDVILSFCHLDFKAELWDHPFVEIREFFSPFESETAKDETELLAGLKKVPDSLNITFLTETAQEEQTLKTKLSYGEIKALNTATFETGYLSSGFVMQDMPLALFPNTELTKRYQVRREKMRSTFHTPVSEFHELEEGDFVVHFNFGIGRYLGVRKKPSVDGSMRDVMVIEYSGGGSVNVPLSQSHLVSRYIGSSEELPKLDKIGTKTWNKTKVKAQAAIVDYAKELLKRDAMRSIQGGKVYPDDGPEVEAFEAEFPYEETEDQLRAIAEIKEDMRSENAVDRLICGDVGYGKTEVAMRAAFKAVMDGGAQVAVLVPTTVLAMQHFESFRDRMANFPIRVEGISRFRKPAEVKQILEDVRDGKVDIIIGTHRLLSDDIVFDRLGMVIVDEEQKFGVRAKEKLKSIKTGVDFLSLSATPIPRTLYMSLVGVRPISTISTPPHDRLPIQTVISKKEPVTVKTALQRELARDGQAYVIHNRVETIESVARYVEELVPEANVVVGHGQMSSAQLDKVFHSFKEGKADILVATSIIENGVDIPNANTILVDRADYFGLADLYQIRGRVGRWNRPSYAYFLLPVHGTLPPQTMKRLLALKEASGHGGGMKVAMRDLEIRGAGDLLGTRQSGQVSSVGFHLYCKMLKKTLTAIKQAKLPDFNETRMEFYMEAVLPEAYIAAPSVRMEIYNRLGESVTVDEVNAIFTELEDRFGPLPGKALWLRAMMRIKTAASLRRFTHIKIEKFKLYMEKIQRGQKRAKTISIPPAKEVAIYEKLIMYEIEKF